MKISQRKKSAFTLVEIMTVVIIVGVITIAAIPAYQKLVTEQTIGSIKDDSLKISQSVKLFEAQNGGFLSPGKRGCESYQSGGCRMDTATIERALNISLNKEFRYECASWSTGARLCIIISPATGTASPNYPMDPPFGPWKAYCYIDFNQPLETSSFGSCNVGMYRQ